MIRFLLRSIHYLGAFLNGRLDEVMDPRVQIEQAIGEARRQHGLLSEQAAAVIANQRELEIKISPSQSETDRLRRCAEQALLLAERSRTYATGSMLGSRARPAVASSPPDRLTRACSTRSGRSSITRARRGSRRSGEASAWRRPRASSR